MTANEFLEPDCRGCRRPVRGSSLRPAFSPQGSRSVQSLGPDRGSDRRSDPGMEHHPGRYSNPAKPPIIAHQKAQPRRGGTHGRTLH